MEEMANPYVVEGSNQNGEASQRDQGSKCRQGWGDSQTNMRVVFAINYGGRAANKYRCESSSCKLLGKWDVQTRIHRGLQTSLKVEGGTSICKSPKANDLIPSHTLMDILPI